MHKRDDDIVWADRERTHAKSENEIETRVILDPNNYLNMHMWMSKKTAHSGSRHECGGVVTF